MYKDQSDIISRVHKLVNERLYKDFPCLDEANIGRHPEGSIKISQVKYIVEAYDEIWCREQSVNRDNESGGSKCIRKVSKKRNNEA